MWLDSEFATFCLIVAVQLAGLVSVAIARCGQCDLTPIRHQRFFLICLGLVGAVALLVALAGNGSWVAIGTTVAWMAVGATFEWRPARADI